MKKIIYISLILICYITSFSQTNIAPNSSKIKITGALFNDVSSERIIFYRHSQHFYALPDYVVLGNDAKAKTNTGISLNFKTDADNIKINFKMQKVNNSYWLRTVYYIDGDSIETIKYKRDNIAAGDSTFVIDINNPSNGSHVYQIVLPNWCTYGFYGLTLTGGSESLENYNLPSRPFYVAYGNSITHGRGQHTGDQTYPWILANRMGWEMYNVSIGGSKVSVPMAEMIKNEFNTNINYLTILIGYNDVMSLAHEDTNFYRKHLISFIDTVRAGHPETNIIVIGQTYTTATENGNGVPADFDKWRETQKYIVDSLKANGDSQIYYINGADYANYNDLNNPPNDKVHLSINGAYHLGNALADTLIKIFGNPNIINYQTTDKVSLKIYPNPAKDILYIDCTNKSSKIDIFDVTGKNVISKSYPENTNHFSINIQKLTPGIYFVKTENIVKTNHKYFFIHL